MADEKQTFFLDLDIKDFTEKALNAKGRITSIGDAENLSGLTEGLTRAGAIMGAVAVAALALKTTFDLVFEGEQIRKTNALFDQMSQSIGKVGETFKNDILSATKGLADDTDVLQAANKAIITMGQSAEKLPQIMELARKVTQNFGGDLVERFEQINYAIASGSTRMLKANGIIIDTDKAVKAYAKSLGVSTSALTEIDRKQAVLNATLEYGNKKLKDVNNGAESAINLWTQLKVIVGNIRETFVLAFEKTAGPALKMFLSDMKELSEIAKVNVLARFGEGAEQSAAKITLMKERLDVMFGDLAKYEERANGEGWLNWILFSQKGFRIKADKLKAEIDTLLHEIDELETQQAYQKGAQETETGGTKDDAENIAERNKKIHTQELKMQEEILRMRETHNRVAIDMAESQVELEKAQQDQRMVYFEEFEARKAELRQQRIDGSITSEAQYHEMLSQIDQEYYDKLRQMNEQSEAQIERMEDNRLKKSQNMYEGMSRAAEVSAARANRALSNFGKQGMMVMDVLKQRGSDAFVAFGRAAVDHSQSASQIMKGFFLNALADIAQAQGQLYLAAGLVNPASLAAGAALLALSGVLRALAGSAGGGSSLGSGGDYGGGGGAYGAISDGSASRGPEPQAEKKAVTLQVMGHYFETEQTKTKLMDMIRDATDATDFKYVQIGKT